MLRRKRLERLVAVLDGYEGPLQLLSRLEYRPKRERMLLRQDNSPLTIAYHDAVLREEGLASDRLGDAVVFFDLSWRQAHHAFCDCHYAARVTPQMVAERVRSLARRMSFGEIWSKLRRAIGSGFGRQAIASDS
jgi:hypothetical protein